MIHFAARAVPGTLLFRSWFEAAELWAQVTRRVRSRALVLMPDHIHALLADEKEVAAMRRALRGYALWRNHHRAESGAVWEHGPQPTPVRGRKHEKRTQRYIHLNPCRNGLTTDPLGWPFSTHRDAVGLVIPPSRTPVRDPDRFHTWISSDPTVDPHGTRLPCLDGNGDPSPKLEAVLAAVSALTRTPVEKLKTHCPARGLLLRAALTLCKATNQEIATFAGVDPSTVSRNRGRTHPRMQTVRRVLGDPRFPPLHSRDLTHLAAWRPYRSSR